MEPKVSVIMPCYNHAKYIEEAMESILKQTYTNWELIIMDDYSTDASTKIARKIASKDKRIRVYTHKYNQGTSTTLNDAMKACSGEYIAIQSADDMSVTHRLECQVTYLLENPTVSSISGHVLPINDNGDVTENTQCYEAIFHRENTSRIQVLHDFFLASNFISNSSQMIPAHIIQRIGYNTISLFQLHDYEYNIRLAFAGDIYVMPEILLYYRVRDDGLNVSLSNTRGMHLRQFVENYMILDRYLEITDVDFFMQIFGAYAKRIGTVRSETIPYFLAMIAIHHCEEVPKKLWGFKVLYKICSQEGMFERLRKDCGLTYTQFTQLAKKVQKYFSQ